MSRPFIYLFPLIGPKMSTRVVCRDLQQSWVYIVQNLLRSTHQRTLNEWPKLQSYPSNTDRLKPSFLIVLNLLLADLQHPSRGRQHSISPKDLHHRRE
jgi:hypothetical protein